MSILRRALTHLNVQVELVACSRQISTLPTVCRWHQDKVENRNLRRFGYKDYVSRHYILRNWQQVWAHFRINTMITYISVFTHILKYDKIRLGTRLECRVRDHRPAGWPKNLKAEYTIYTPRPNYLKYTENVTMESVTMEKDVVPSYFVVLMCYVDNFK